jgi:hypothetical protein
MEAEVLREKAVESLDRQRRSSILIGGYVVGSLVLIAIWALAGAGYFWPGWPMAIGLLVGATAGLARSWSDRSFSETTVRARMSQMSGQAPPGIQR